MDKYTKVVLTMVVSLGLSTPTKAVEKVFYCQMTGSVDVSVDGVEQYELEKFKFKVTPTEVVFGSGGSTHGLRIKITNLPNFNTFTASDDFVMLSFNRGVLSSGVLSLGDHITAITARCDDF